MQIEFVLIFQKMTIMKTIVCICLALLMSISNAKAQLTNRIEYSTKDDYDNETLLPLKEQGLLILSFHRETQEGKRWMKYELFDTNLKRQSVDSLRIDKGMYIHNTQYENGKGYIILRENNGDFAIISYDPITRKIKVIDGEYTKKASMRNIIIEKDMIVFNSTYKRTDRIGIINPETGECHYVDMQFQGVRDRKIFALENTVIDNVVYSLVQVDRALHLVRIDAKGQRLGETQLNDGSETQILQASISKAGKNFFVTGTYSKKGNMAQGIFFAELENWKFKYDKYYNFLDLSNFTEYMSQKKQKKMERKKEQAEAKGKEILLNYNMASHKIKTDGSHYYYLGEAYIPTYITTGTGRTMITQFAGYQYTHATLVKFDKEGNIMWDICFPMSPNYKPMYVKRFISMGMDNNNVNLLYANNKNFVSKLFSNTDGKVIKDKTTEQIETTNEDEKVRRAKPAESQHWFDNNFVVYGVQVVQNTNTKERRKVMYINKYTIQ